MRELPDGPVAAPVLTRDYVISVLQSGVVLARRISDGKDVWARQPRVTGTTTLATDDETVVAGGDMGIEGLSVASGQPRWALPALKPSVPPVVRGGWVLVAAAGRLLALRANDGAEVWSIDAGSIGSRPAIDGDVVYVPLTDGRLIALDVTTGAHRWEREVGADPGEPLIYGDRIYLGAGKALVALATEDGAREWAYPIGAAIVGAPAADAERIYLASMDNLLRAFSRSSGSREWRKDLGHRPSAGPLLTGNTVTVPGRARSLRGFDKRTGKQVVTELKLPHTAVTPPALLPPREGLPGRLAIVVNDLGRPWLLVLASETAPLPPSLPLTPFSAVPGTLLALPAIPQ